MKFRHRDGTIVHLAYCTNVHPAEDLDGVLEQLDRYATPIRERIGADSLGLGLWLARDVATTLRSEPAALDRLRAELDARALEVVTLNGFPYRGFQEPVVKHAVYSPDWTQPARLDYTLDLAWLLARLLPDDTRRGSISTLPLGWRHSLEAPARAPGDAPGRTPDWIQAARRQLDSLGTGLAGIEAAEGRPIRVGFEPEPGCLVETTADAAEYLTGVDGTDIERIGVCLDACHLGVAFEDPQAALHRLDQARLPVVKTQASCALEALDPSDPEAQAALASFSEPRFLHQTRTHASGALGPTGAGDGTGRARIRQPTGTDDLDEALGGPGGLDDEQPWRVHFHVPLNAEPPHPLGTTRPVLEQTLSELLGGGSARTDHVEVETYTWAVLPEHQRAGGTEDVVNGIAAELSWARERLLELGLEDVQE